MILANYNQETEGAGKQLNDLMGFRIKHETKINQMKSEIHTTGLKTTLLKTK